MSAKLSASIASTRSTSSNQSASNCWARWRVASYPCEVSSAAARRSIGPPTCHPPVPALTTSTRSSRPAASSRSLTTTSAIGERQMFPRQTTATRYGVPVGVVRGGRSLACSVIGEPRGSSVVRQQHVETPAHDRDDQSADQGGPEAVHVEAEAELPGQPARQHQHQG